MRFDSVMLLIRDVTKSAKFYVDGLQFRVNHMSEHWAELQSGSLRVSLNRVDGEAAVTAGYTPFMCFHVRNLDTTVYKLIELGAILDGPIKYPSHGKIATLRAPDGHMIGLFEPVVNAGRE